MSNQRIVSASYFILGSICFVVLNQLLSDAWEVFGISNRQIVGQVDLPVLISLVLSGGGMFALIRHPKVNPFLLEVVSELRQVVWPTRQETISHTGVVIVTVLIVAGILGFFDAVWSELTRLLLNPNL